MNKFIDDLNRYALERPDAPLITIDGVTVTYGQFGKDIINISSALSEFGIHADEKVGLIIPNSLQWYRLFWSAIKIGAQPVPIDPQSGEVELKRLIDTADTDILFIADHYRNNNIISAVDKVVDLFENVRKVVVVTDFDKNSVSSDKFISYDDFMKLGKGEDLPVFDVDSTHVMSLACTSGSTGNPKVLTVPYEGFYDAIVDISDYLSFTSDDTMMIGMPLYHQGGFGMGSQVLVKGGHVIYQPQFEPVNFLKTVEKYKVTALQLTSTLAKIILSVPDFDSYDISAVRICYFAGEVLPKEIADVFVEKLGIRVINVIGSSETATMVVWDSDVDRECDPSDFRELPFTKAKVIDENGEEVEDGISGELCIYTSAVIFNYRKNPVESEKVVYYKDKRWFKTGDMTVRLPDGRLRFVGRNKRIIKRGANLVHAEEVEAFILSHPLVEACAVTAEDHPVIGQQIVAYIQPVNGEQITRGDLARFFNGKLSAYKVPDKVVLTDELPKDIGKIQFKYIRQPNVVKK